MYYNDYLAHYGVKGMKWGVRRKAKKDAKEYARAKMYYGEGAGNRRKLIKATVDQRSKDPSYKKAFDEALSRQDMSKHASAAKRERKVANAKIGTANMGRGLINAATGNIGRASASAAALYLVGRYTGVNKIIAEHAKQRLKNVMSDVQGRQRSKQILEEMLRRGRR